MEQITPYLPTIGWILALAALALTVVVGIILAFHSIRYAMNTAVTTLALGVYIGVSSVLLLMLFGGLVAFTSAL